MNADVKERVHPLPDELSSIRKWMLKIETRLAKPPENDVGVIYTRFSSRNQKEVTHIIQAEWCRSYAARNNIPLRKEHLFSDSARTGDSLDSRGALERVRKLVQDGHCKHVFVYGMDRLSRRASHALMLFDEFIAAGVQVHVCSGTASGRIDSFQACILALFAQEERERLIRGTGFAQWLAAERGVLIGGIPYGYRRGQKRGTLEIHHVEMAVVVRIFDMFVNGGLSATQIAFLLNAAKPAIPAPGGGLWRHSTIAGYPGKGNGILRNAKYVGWYIFGVRMTVRTPGKAKISQKLRDPKHWIKRRKPEWRGVDLAVWQAANDRLEAMSNEDGGEPRERLEKYTLLFRDRYYCTCGSEMEPNKGGAGRSHTLVCKAAYHHGTCDQKQFTGAYFTDTEVLRVIRDEILSDAAVNLFKSTYVDEIASARAEAGRERELKIKRADELEDWIRDSVLQAFSAGCSDADMIAFRMEWTKERDQLLEDLKNNPLPELVPDHAEAEFASLRDAMDRLILRMPFTAETEEDMRLVRSLRRLIANVVIDRKPGGRTCTLLIDATLHGLISRAGSKDKAVALRRFKRICPPTPKGHLRPPEFLKLARDKAATNEWGTTKEDWAVIEPLWSGMSDTRSKLFLDAILFYLRLEKIGVRAMPAPFDLRTIQHHMHTIVSKGFWQLAYDAMVEIDSPTVAGLDLTKLSRLTAQVWSRRKPSSPRGKRVRSSVRAASANRSARLARTTADGVPSE